MRDIQVAGRGAYNGMGKDFHRNWEDFLSQQGKANLALNFNSSYFPLLWEFLHTGDPRKFNSYESPKEFWGYQYSISRRLVYQKSIQYINSPVHFLFCSNHELAHSKEEQEILHEMVARKGLKWVCLDDYPSPEDVCSELDLADSVMNAWTSDRFDFIHLSCHLVIPPQDSLDILGAHLELSFEDREVKIHLDYLNALSCGEKFFSVPPLTFINACHSMTNTDAIHQVESFPQTLIGLGAGAVIATACNIPDLFAKEFSRKFYEILFDDVDGQSPTIGQALCLTRRYFIDQFNNPLGLAYGLYAHPNLLIEWD
jgi:hypothetical protein